MPLIQVHSQVALVLHSAVEAFGPFAFDPLRSLPSEQVLKSLGNPDNRPVHGWITAQLMVLMCDLSIPGSRCVMVAAICLVGINTIFNGGYWS